MKNNSDHANLLVLPKSARSSQQKSLPIISKNKLSLSGATKNFTPDISQPKSPNLYATTISFPRSMAPLSSQRTSRLENPLSPQMSRPDKFRQSTYSFSPQDFNYTFRSGFFHLGVNDPNDS